MGVWVLNGRSNVLSPRGSRVAIDFLKSPSTCCYSLRANHDTEAR